MDGHPEAETLTRQDVIDRAQVVRIVDFDVPIQSLAIFLLKLAIAFIPAGIVLAVVGMALWGIIGTLALGIGPH